MFWLWKYVGQKWRAGGISLWAVLIVILVFIGCNGEISIFMKLQWTFMVIVGAHPIFSQKLRKSWAFNIEAKEQLRGKRLFEAKWSFFLNYLLLVNFERLSPKGRTFQSTYNNNCPHNFSSTYNICTRTFQSTYTVCLPPIFRPPPKLSPLSGTLYKLTYWEIGIGTMCPNGATLQQIIISMIVSGG